VWSPLACEFHFDSPFERLRQARMKMEPVDE
jgi:hypothetical protein